MHTASVRPVWLMGLLAAGLLIAGAALASAPPTPDPEEAGAPSEDSSLPANGPAAKGGKTEESANPSKTATLRVVVTGDGEPVRQAEVKMLEPVDGDEPPRRYTDARGEATLAGIKPGPAKLRILATNWQSALREIRLVAGTQQLIVELQPLP